MFENVKHRVGFKSGPNFQIWKNVEVGMRFKSDAEIHLTKFGIRFIGTPTSTWRTSAIRFQVDAGDHQMDVRFDSETTGHTNTGFWYTHCALF